jgi:hypothetical protein
MKEIKQLNSGYIFNSLEEILEEYKALKNFFKHNERLHRVNNGDLLSIMEEEAMKFSTAQARKDNKDMAVAINYLQKIVEHKSQLYTFDIQRTAKTSQDLVDKYVKLLDINTHMGNANNFYNASKSVMVELYQDRDNNINMRPIPNDRFFVFSDDIVEPNEPTAYIKIIKTCKLKEGSKVRIVELLHIYTDLEFMAVYSDGTVLEYKENIYGVAPFVYINKEAYNLIPQASRDTLQNIIQVNSIFTNSNVCAYYQGHPIRFFKNIDKDLSNMNINPNDILVLNGREGSTLNPEIGELASSLDISKSIDLAAKILQETLFINDMKTSDVVVKAQSAISLNLKDNDMLENRKTQTVQFKPAEEELWETLAIMHDAIMDNMMAGEDTPVGRFGADFEIEVSFELPDTNAQVVAPNAQPNMMNPPDVTTAKSVPATIDSSTIED